MCALTGKTITGILCSQVLETFAATNKVHPAGTHYYIVKAYSRYIQYYEFNAHTYSVTE